MTQRVRVIILAGYDVIAYDRPQAIVKGIRMNNEQLRAQLADLHAELQQAGALEPQQRETIETLASDIEQLLKRDEIKPDHYRSLRERFNEDVAELEASHPQITLLMRRVIESLAYLGI
jgi:Domain of unknown function (DUF4404)